MHHLTLTAARQSGADAYAMAGLAACDIDMVQLHDTVTINMLLFLEALGSCANGEGGTLSSQATAILGTFATL